ncbi:MAG TPA: flagellar type III secretion system pore protein FliP [Gemmatimonadaceae bacterium]|nr:flagellar type III secretion system pore protein FliP [Gemmatimonadaceae bacterium]
MSVGEVVWIIATLGFVLVLLGVALKVLRRFAPAASTRAGLRMEIVQRLALGPKQGIAVIRVGERLVAISLGEGGVHRLFELEPSEAVAMAPARPAGALPGDPAPSGVDFRAAFRSAMKTAGLVSTVVFALQMAPRAVHAQGATTRATAAAPAAKAASKTATESKTATTPAPGETGATIPQLDVRMGSTDGGLHLSGNVGAVVMLGMLTLLPSMILMMTGFTRIFIVLGFLRQALGTPTAPPTQLVAALALILTGFVMAPTLNEVNQNALQPWLDGKIDQAQMLDIGGKPFRAFMLRQTRRQDLSTFVRLSGAGAPASVNDVPLVTLTSAFVVSELRTAFQIGFALFLPFIVIDIAVASVLMSMGMFMLPPAMISLPFKLLLFVLVDGWSLVIQSVVQSFR